MDAHKLHGMTPAFDLYMGREIRDYTTGEIRYTASKWANEDKDDLIVFEQKARAKVARDPQKYNLRELIGKRLACWCMNLPVVVPVQFPLPLKCHVQVWLKLLWEQIQTGIIKVGE